MSARREGRVFFFFFLWFWGVILGFLSVLPKGVFPPHFLSLEENVPASPATALASSVFPVPGGP